jgi:hypothetical protein
MNYGGYKINVLNYAAYPSTQAQHQISVYVKIICCLNLHICNNVQEGLNVKMKCFIIYHASACFEKKFQ